LGTGFAIRVVGAVFIPILAYSAIQLIFPADHQGTVLVMILCSAFIFQTFETITWYFQAHVRSKFNVWATNLAFVIATGVRVILIERRAPVWQFAVTQVLELALAATGLAIAYKSIGGRITAWRLNLTLARQMLLQSWPVILSGMAIVTYMRIDMVMLKSMSGDVSVGIYAAATKVSEVWYFIPMAVVGSVTPAIIRARDQPLLYYQRLRRLFAFMTFLGLVIGSVLALLSTWIIHTLYSDAYIAAAPVLAVHVWASVFVFLGVAQAPWDFAENRLKLGLYRTLAGAISNIALNLILIPKYAAMGAAVATVVSYAISGVLANACYAPTRPIFRLQVLSLRLTDMFIKDNSGHSGLGES
jgi:PST family polysaccharide transporter